MSQKKVTQLNVHPAAALFPMLSDDEMAELARSISNHGLREKIHVIQVDGEWQVLDGRNRLEALRRMGVTDEQIFSNYVRAVTAKDLETMSATPEEYVLMANIERRNLTQSQRRDLAGKLAIMLAERQKDLPKEQQTDTLAEAAQKAGVSRRTAATAKKAAGATKPRMNPSKTRKPTGPGPSVIVGQLEKARASIKNTGHNWKPAELRSVRTLAGHIVADVEKAEAHKQKLDAEAKEAKAKSKK